jgi:hypothetical protein
LTEDSPMRAEGVFMQRSTFAFLPACTAAWAAPESNLKPGLKLLDAIRYKQVSIIPVVETQTTADRSDYMTLAAGLERKEVDVAEDAGGASVNRVTVKNRSTRPLLLLGGEVILGGQQDRIIGKDTLVPPRETASVEVYCVEHGRWNGAAAFTSAGGVAESKLRVRAKFRSNQGQVWDEVAKKTESLGAQSASGTYRGLAVGEAGQKATAPYRAHIVGALAALPERERLVGMVAAINGRIVSADIFANPKLFASYRDRLLYSVFITAADVAEAKAQPAVAPADVRTFMEKADAAPATPVMDGKNASTTEHLGKGVLNSTVRLKPAKDGDKPKSVYESYQADE